MSKVKLLSLFSGIGAFEKALSRLGVDYELINYCEIDKYASKSYSAIHGEPESKNLWDITKVDESQLSQDIDLLCYGFPCVDISSAGLQKGLFNADGTKTRSGLFFDALRIIQATRPKVAIAENVKNLTSKKFAEQFQIVLSALANAGYKNYWQVLNAKDYGIPQNRERVFIVSIRNDILINSFRFPEPFPLSLRLKDMLESVVDEKFYLSAEMIKYIDGKKNKPYRFNVEINEPSGILKNPIRAQGDKPMVAANPQIIQIGETRSGGERARILSAEGIASALTTTDYKQPQQIAINEPMAWDDRNKYLRRDGCIGALTTDGSSPRRNNRIIEPINPDREGNCRTIKSQYYKTSKSNFERSGTMGATGVNDNLRIRKLTPKECFRLMGFSDEDYLKAAAVNSNTQLYRQAGNSIVVDVLCNIFATLQSAYLNQDSAELNTDKSGQYILF